MKAIDLKRRMMGLAALSICLASQAAEPEGAASTLLVLGDSLSAEYGLARGTGWVALLQARLASRKLRVNVVNASVSGETTSGGLSRLPALLQSSQAQAVVIELGANDALRGLPVASMQVNLNKLVGLCQQAGAHVLLVGMQVPPNFGKRYNDEMAEAFQRVAKDRQVPLVPFLLKGVADRPDARDWFQADGLHPLAKAHPVILDLIWPALLPLLLGRQPRT